MRTLALWSIKGGVGKTAAAVNLAHVASAAGLRVLLWDLDPQGSASFYLRVGPRVRGGVDTIVRRSTRLEEHLHPTDFPNLRVLPADFSYRLLDRALDARKKPRRRLALKLDALRDRFDLAVLDCAPSVSTATEAVLTAADVVAVPLIPSTLSLRALEQVRLVTAELEGKAPRLLPYLSMIDRRRRMHLEVAAECLADPGFLPTAIPIASEVEKMGIRRAPLTATHPSHRAAAAFRSLWGEIAARIGLRSSP